MMHGARTGNTDRGVTRPPPDRGANRAAFAVITGCYLTALSGRISGNGACVKERLVTHGRQFTCN